MYGGKGLYHHLALHLTTTRASRHLRKQLKGALTRAEIGQMKAGIGIDYAHQRNARKVQALGDHLGADEYVDFAASKIT